MFLRKCVFFYLFFAKALLIAADIPVSPASSIQAAIDAAQPGDTITLAAGVTYNQSFILRAKNASATSYITIRSSAAASFQAGARITPANASSLARIVANNGTGGNTITTQHGAHHYRLTGLEITPAAGDYAYDIVQIGTADEAIEADLPNNIQIDHCYVHGDPVAGSKHGITVNGKALTISDSYISDVKSSTQDAEAIMGWNTPGPITITNNYIEAAAENILFGSAKPSIVGLIPSNITVRGNYIHKPQSWKTSNYIIKNLFEVKFGKNILVEGNILDGSWGPLQSGSAIMLTPRTENGTVPWATVDTITFRYNIVLNVNRVVDFLGFDDGQVNMGTGLNLTMENNLFPGVGQWGVELLGPKNVTINHNTILAGEAFLFADDAPTTGLVYTNNILQYGTLGVWGNGTLGGLATFNKWFPGIVFTNNAILDGTQFAAQYPGGNFFTTTATVGFTNAASGDYSLTSSSPYLASGTDGKALGADIATIKTMTANVISGSAVSNIPVPTSNSSAAFVRIDTATQGNWTGVYGADGYLIVGDQTKNPAYVTPTTTAPTWVWNANATDVRALQRASNPATRVAGTITADAKTFNIELPFSDQASHLVAVYCLDYDSNLRRQTFDLLDALTGQVLDSRQLTNPFDGGAYIVWNVTGRVTLRITQTGSVSPVVSGLFFGGSTTVTPKPSASASFVKVDTTTQGTWNGVYGGDGYLIVGDQTKNPSYVSPASTAPTYVWASATTPVQALQKASNPASRVAGTMYGTTNTFTIDLPFTDQTAHTVAVYSLDYDTTERRQILDVLDQSTGQVLDSRQLTGAFNGGAYIVWNITGHVTLRITSTGGFNPVVSGIFFGGAGTVVPKPTAAASFVKIDTATQGTWTGVYGGDGYLIVGDQTRNPSYVAPASTAPTFVWASTTTLTQALQRASNPSTRVAGTMYGTSNTFTIDLPFTDQVAHAVAIYCLDYDTTQRRQTMDILDPATGQVIDSRQLTSAFNNGAYVVWNITGHVTLRVTSTGGFNPVVSGIFFGGASTPVSVVAASFVKIDTTTQGNWNHVYGGDGYMLVGDQVKNPSYVTPVTTAATYVWAGTPTDVRALQRASNTSTRVASTYYGPTNTFTIDLPFTDQASHIVAAYCLDWDTTARRQTLEIVNPATGAVLDTQSLNMSFANGAWVVWNVTGHVALRVTMSGGYNPVVSGLFFGPGA